jgi:hypothetical protein
MKSEQQIKKIASICGFDFSSIRDKAELLERIVNRKGFSKSPVLAGFDINGPLVSTKDASMTPYEGVREALELLTSFDSVHVCIITGWDLNTAKYFVDEKLKLDGISIVAEKGMIYLLNGKIYHLYQNSAKEIIEFAEALFEVAQNRELQITIQPNESSGCQCVYFEGFKRGNVKNHPLNLERLVSLETLVKTLKKNNIKYEDKGDTVQVHGTPFDLYELLRHHLPLFPLRLIKQTRKIQNAWTLKVDPEDNEQFGWEPLLDVGQELSTKTRRKPDANRDFCIDFSTALAEKEGFSKNKAVQLLGKEKFGGDFLLCNVGDRPDDRVEGKNTLFFPQEGSTAVEVKDNIAFPVIDGREYALVISMFISNNIR